MITGNTDAIQQYNTWFTENYYGLRKYCKRYRIEEDLLNDVYLNVRDRIARSGFTESYYTTYVKRALKNININEAKKLNNKHYIEIDDTDYTNTIENKLQAQDDTEKDTIQYREEVLHLSKKIFEYITCVKKYSDEELFVFRCYYLMPNRFTYQKLTVMTGIDKSKCTRIIKTFKKDIRENFLTWLKND